MTQGLLTPLQTDVTNHPRPDDQTQHHALSPTVTSPAQAIRGFFHCRVLRPLLRLLNSGSSPRRLAWSVAIALLIGVNPLLGTTTVVMLAVAWLFNLDFVASQIGIHVVTPLQFLLFLPFVHAGVVLFHTSHLPMSKEEILHLSHKHPLQLIHMLWQWEWHALVVWAVLSATVAPVLATQIQKLLALALRRHQSLVA